MNQSQWDLGRFVKTLSYYGVVPILSSFDWFQAMFNSRPNPTLMPDAIAFGTTPLAVGIGPVAPDVLQQVTQAGYQVCLLENWPSSPQALASDSDILHRAALILYGSPADSVEALRAEPAWNALMQAIASPADAPLPRLQSVFDFRQPNTDLQDIWGALDDVVMGGVSQSGIRRVGTSAIFAGQVSTANSGGFASIRTRNFIPPLDFSGYDGLLLRVRGDGQRYKFMLRTETNWDSLAYCYSFDTDANDWVTVRIPFNELRPVFRAKTVANAPAIALRQICALQIMLSKFEYDGALNPSFQAGAFQLELQSVQLYDESCPSVLPRQLMVLTPGEHSLSLPLPAHITLVSLAQLTGKQ